MSRKLDATLKKVEKIFDKCYEKGITPSGKRWGETTKTTYLEMVNAFVRDYHEAYGIADLTKMTDEDKINQLIQNRIDKYHEGQLGEAYNIKTLAAGLKALNLGIKETNVFKKPFTIGNPDEIRRELKEQYVIRNSEASSVMRAKPNECESVLNNIKNQGYDVKTREVAYHVGKISMLTGGRITAVLKLKASDFILDKNNHTIQFVKDKGGLTRSVRVGEDTAKFLESLTKERGEKERLFSTVRTKHNKGTFKSVKEMRKEVEKIISNAGKHLTKSIEVTVRDKDGKPKQVTVKQKFSHHSFRKSFALDRTSFYLKKFSSPSAIKKYVANRIKENPRLKEKLDTLRERINKDRKEDRKLTPMEYAIFFGSVDMGHFRNDVITSFYTTFKEVEAYVNEEQQNI